jgi:hypothetical protein
VIAGASDVYGAFASMFGLLVWIALLARVTLLASEINVVRNKHLWPRALMPGRPTEADRTAYDESVQRAALFSETAKPPGGGLVGQGIVTPPRTTE